MNGVPGLASDIAGDAIRLVPLCAPLLLLVVACAHRRAAQARYALTPCLDAAFAKALLIVCVLTTTAQASGSGMSAGLLAQVQHLWGTQAAGRVLDWQRHLLSVAGAPDSELAQLSAVNTYWNRTRYAEDPRQWGQADYWATPVEMLGSNGGDCEDYVFGKYFTLRQLGMPAGKLRITYVRAAGLTEGHMVLAYYATFDADPLILDNMTDEMLPASRREDLQPVYSFNDDDLWAAGVSGRAGSANQVRAWRELLERMAKERVL
jgi:predicted transglutaminase-like cysteine proteinase